MKIVSLVIGCLLASATVHATTVKCVSDKNVVFAISIDKADNTITVKQDKRSPVEFEVYEKLEDKTDDGIATYYRIKSGPTTNELTFSGELATLEKGNKVTNAGLTLLNDQLAKTVVDTGIMNCK
ncbi:hypothetical protein QJS83_08365 [Bdellovibrio sp. 22V]|uniref:hypothetical protein n=1 Tax=Bdellovibrio TaxID=958 RepID=UPI00254282E3|nr:hypothetical protein [Bdellovibrio sp. 22V]WII73890.1 hypothetical protein QJS83_08365 [Bdellovibrio sp. 22V]